MKIALIGYGKMGKSIDAIIHGSEHKVVLRIGMHNRDELTGEQLSKCDVAIEFTSPSAAYGNIMKCFDAGVPVVCGSTGWYDRLEEVKKTCMEKNNPLFMLQILALV